MMNREEHLLTILSEECSEVTKEACKCLRFGMDDFHPKYGNIPNNELLAEECEQLEAMIEMLREEGFIREKDQHTLDYKKFKVEKYLAYSKERGKYE